jgi:uncharacterized repeat protein (TIGR03803 family)
VSSRWLKRRSTDNFLTHLQRIAYEKRTVWQTEEFRRARPEVRRVAGFRRVLIERERHALTEVALDERILIEEIVHVGGERSAAYEKGSLNLAHTFDDTDGATPIGQLLLSLDGNIYGTTSGGGADAAGTLFALPFSH